MSPSPYPPFDGRGAFLHPSRWFPAGCRVVYLASSPALAALEVLVQSTASPPRADLLLHDLDLPEVEVHAPASEDLPSNWAAYPQPPSARAYGLAWLREARTPLLSVPSAVYKPANPRDRSFVLNLEHRATPRNLTASSSAPFHFAPPFSTFLERLARTALSR